MTHGFNKLFKLEYSKLLPQIVRIQAEGAARVEMS